MTDREQQLRLLRHLSMEKRAWYGARPGAQAPQLPQPGMPDPSESPAPARLAAGGTLAARSVNQAADAAANVQQNLAMKMQPLKQVDGPVRPASQPTARNRNDRMARQVTQPPAGKTLLAHVTSREGVTKIAQAPFWNKATQVAEDAQKALASPVQALGEGMREIPALRKAENWMTRNVGRDPVTWASQEVVQPAVRAGAKALTTKIPGINASPAQGLAAVGEGMVGMPVVGPVGMGLRGAGMELQAAGRAARALPGAARAVGQRAVQFGDDLAAKALGGASLGPQPAFAGAGGRVTGAEASAVARAPKVPTQFKSQGLTDLPGTSSVSTPPAQVAETAVDAVQQRPSLWQRLVGRGPSLPPAPPKPNPQALAKDPAGLVRQYQRTDISGRGPGMKATDPAAMAEDLRQMGYETMSRPERLVRRAIAFPMRTINQVPMPPTSPLGPDASRARELGQRLVRALPVVGPEVGGAGLIRSGSTGRITPGSLATGLAGGTAVAAAGTNYGRDYLYTPARKMVGGVPATQAVKEIRDPAAETARQAQEILERMTPEQRDAYISRLPGG